MTRRHLALAFGAALPSACNAAQPVDAPSIRPESVAIETSSREPDFFELVDSRRSIRSFTADPVLKSDLDRVLAAASRAPSAGNLQAYRIVVVTERERRQHLSHAAFDQASVAQAPVVLVFLADPACSARHYAERGERLFALQDATIAASYAQLASHALGLASVWVGAFDDGAVLRAVRAPSTWVPTSLLAVGHAAETPAKTPRRDLDELVHREQFRASRP